MLRDGGGGADGHVPVRGDPRGVRLRGLAQEQAVVAIRGGDCGVLCEGALGEIDVVGVKQLGPASE